MRAALAPILLAPVGIPRQGLIAHHDLYSPNILLQSNNFGTSWSAGRATAVQSAATYAPSGSLAWKLVEDDSAANSHYLTLTQVTQEATYTVALTAKAAERTWVQIFVPTTSNRSAYFNLGAGAVGAVSAGATSTITALGDGWYRCTMTLPCTAGTGAVQIFLAEGNSDTIFSGGGSAPYTEADPGIYIADAQLYPSATLPPYQATTTLQSFADLSGRGNTLYRGSNATAADSSDPVVLGPGLGFVADDYCLTGNLSQIATATGPATVIVAGTFASAADKGYFALGYGGGGTLRVVVTPSVGSAGQVKVYSNSTASSALVVGTAPNILAVTIGSPTVTVMRLDTMASQGVANQSPAEAPRFVLGANQLALYPIDAATFYECLIYNRILSSAELKRVYKVIKNKWAARSITIA